MKQFHNNIWNRRYKFVCEDCNEATWFNNRERTRSAGMQCSYCGSRHLVPSKKSLAKNNLPIFHDLKRENAEKRYELQNEPVYSEDMIL